MNDSGSTTSQSAQASAVPEAARGRIDKAPLIVLGVGIVLALLMVVFKPTAQPEPVEAAPPPMVDYIYADPQSAPIMVSTQGTATPRHQIDLVAQVAGRVESVAPHYAEGGFFAAGDALVQIESADYEYALVMAESRVADAKQLLAVEKGRARQAKREWRDLGDDESNALFLRKPQLASAESKLQATIADHKKAQLNLERTAIKAPFDGRVWKKLVDEGQYVTPGTPIARIYSTDRVEVSLPLTDRQAGLVDLPMGWKAGDEEHMPKVTFTAEFGRKQHQWEGKIVRTEASIDIESRVIFAIAEVENPFAQTGGPVRPQSPMSIGLFVEAKIEGRVFDNVLKLPRNALTREQQIYTLDAENRLHVVDVYVLQANREQAIVVADIPKGTRVVISHVPYATEGLAVSPKPLPSEEEPSGQVPTQMVKEPDETPGEAVSVEAMGDSAS